VKQVYTKSSHYVGQIFDERSKIKRKYNVYINLSNLIYFRDCDIM
jgi:hypothetical protein